jgi:hypothetical protein
MRLCDCELHTHGKARPAQAGLVPRPVCARTETTTHRLKFDTLHSPVSLEPVYRSKFNTRRSYCNAENNISICWSQNFDVTGTLARKCFVEAHLARSYASNIE